MSLAGLMHVAPSAQSDFLIPMSATTLRPARAKSTSVLHGCSRTRVSTNHILTITLPNKEGGGEGDGIRGRPIEKIETEIFSCGTRSSAHCRRKGPRILGDEGDVPCAFHDGKRDKVAECAHTSSHARESYGGASCRLRLSFGVL